MYYVYLLQSQRDGQYYIGHTNNLKKRLREHNSGRVKSTKPRRPFVLVGYEIFPNRSAARYREHDLKQHSDKKRAFIGKLAAERQS